MKDPADMRCRRSKPDSDRKMAEQYRQKYGQRNYRDSYVPGHSVIFKSADVATRNF